MLKLPANVPAHEKLLVLLAERSDAYGRVAFRREEVARTLGVTPRTITRALHRLEALGLAFVARGRGRQVTRAFLRMDRARSRPRRKRAQAQPQMFGKCQEVTDDVTSEVTQDVTSHFVAVAGKRSPPPHLRRPALGNRSHDAVPLHALLCLETLSYTNDSSRGAPPVPRADSPRGVAWQRISNDPVPLLRALGVSASVARRIGEVATIGDVERVAQRVESLQRQGAIRTSVPAYVVGALRWAL